MGYHTLKFWNTKCNLLVYLRNAGKDSFRFFSSPDSLNNLPIKS